MKTIWFLRNLSLALLVPMLAWLVISHLRHTPNSLDDFGPIGTFSFVGVDGRPVTEADLQGKVSVVACFFSCCTTSCPVLTAKMGQLQKELAGLPDVRLISLTVDPEHDTPEKLKTYAATFSADPKRWLFLTGDRNAIEELVKGRLKQGLEKNTAPDATPGNKFDHSERLTLIDRQGRIRGWFPGTTPEGIEELKKAVKQLHD